MSNSSGLFYFGFVCHNYEFLGMFPVDNHIMWKLLFFPCCSVCLLRHLHWTTHILQDLIWIKKKTKQTHFWQWSFGIIKKKFILWIDNQKTGGGGGEGGKGRDRRGVLQEFCYRSTSQLKGAFFVQESGFSLRMDATKGKVALERKQRAAAGVSSGLWLGSGSPFVL